jgi:predicted nucleic acid-binding Zn ribbon protein
VQASWAAVVGPAIAAEAEPVGERAGVLTVACRSAAWAHELQLLGPDLLVRLNDALRGGESAPLVELRVRGSGHSGQPPSGAVRGFP